MSFLEVYQAWAAFKQNFIKRSSYSSYQLLCENHLLPAFSETTEITENRVQQFVLDKLNGGLSQKTVKDILIVLKMILKYGKKHNLCEYTPFDDIMFPTGGEPKKKQVLTLSENKGLIKYVVENFSFRNLGILISVSTGLRIGEICGLKWDDIDEERSYITVKRTVQRIYNIENGKRKTELIIDTPKTRSSNREVPLSPDLIRLIKPLKKIVNPDFFILSNDEKPIEPRTYRVYHQGVMKALGLPALNFHGLRHTFATRCINANVDIKTVSVMLGHSNISTTLNTYVHPNMEQKKSAIKKLFKSLS